MEVSQEASSEEGSSLSRNPKQTRKTQTQFTTHQHFPNSDSSVPVLRRSQRLLAKQKNRQDHASTAVVTKTLDAQHNVSFNKTNSSSSGATLRRSLRSQSTSSTVSSSSSGVHQTCLEDNIRTRKRKRVNSPLSVSPPRKQPRRGNKKSEVPNSHSKGSTTVNRDSDCVLSECESQCETLSTKKTTHSKQRQTKTKRSDKDSARRGKLTNNSNPSVEAGGSPVKRQKRKTKASDTKESLCEESNSVESSKRGRKGKDPVKTTSSRRQGKSKDTGREKEESASTNESSPTRKRGKGKAKVQESLKSKGRKSTSSEKERSCSSNHFYSLPLIHELTKLNMASEENTDQQVPPGESNTASGGGPVPPNAREGDVGGPSRSSGGQPGPEGDVNPLDPFPMNEESRRLHAMLEARGLPPHLLGALGSKMHYILHKSMSSSMSSSNNSRAQQLLSGIETMDDEGLQLQSCIEMGQLLVMGNEDTLSGFPVKQAVPALINLLTLEHNFDMMMNACRALTYMMEALPRSTVVVADAIPVLIEKLQVIQCMDVAEQAISALNLLSKRHGKAILQAGGLNACLLYLDFFSIATQRSALSVAANCCQSVVSEDDFPLVTDALPILSGRLQHQDKRSVECCCLCFSRLIENYFSNSKTLKLIASQGLLSNLQQLLVISPPVINSSTFVAVLRMLSNLCISCPSLAVNLLKLNMADTLRYLLLGPGEITLENIELTTRSPNEVYEILSLASSLMPPLPKDGVFEVEEMINLRRYAPTTVQWEWQGDGTEWRSYGRIENRILEAAHQAHEEECSIAVNGNVYIIDFSSSQQVNEDTGTSRAIRRTVLDLAALTPKKDDKRQLTIDVDARAAALRDDPSLGRTFVEALFGALYEVFNSVAGPGIRNKCLKTILRILYHTDHEILAMILKEIGISSLIATMLKAQDYRVIIGGLQMADILMRKLPDIFVVYFHREGVMHQLQALRDTPLKVVATPKQEMATLITSPPPVPSVATVPITSETSQTPTSTRKRLSDIFRKGKRHFRKTLRGRSDDHEPGPSQSPPLVPRGAEGISSPIVPVVTPAIDGAGVKTPEEGSSSSSGPSSSREYLQKWIQQQSSSFLEKWSEPARGHPALGVVKKLNESSQDLNPESHNCVAALQALCSILLDPSSNVSAFEFMHCKLHTRLMRYLTVDTPECVVPLNIRLRQFVHIFMGLPEEGVPLASWSPSPQVCLMVLLQKLHGCVNQLEQFPVKVHDLPGRRGSQAIKFFNSHHIKCVLERHPSATGTSQWKGGPLRIEPLATIQTLERYMMIRGFGRHKPISRRLEELENDDSEDDVLAQLQGVPGITSDKHSVEFLIGDHVLPSNMTVFQAIRQFSLGSTQHESEEELVSLGRPEIWIRSHTIHYRSVPGTDPSGAGPSTSFSASLPSTPLSETRLLPPSSRKPSWSTGSNVRRRAQSAKFPLPPSGVGPRITRSSSSRDKLTVPTVSYRVTRSSTGPAASASFSGDGEVPKEKSVQLSPLYQALLRIVNFELVLTDPSLPVLKLLVLLNSLNNHWTDLYPGLAGNPIISAGEFTNNKLTAKVTRQLQDPLNVMTGNFPVWMRDLAIKCPCLFPFECRQTLFYLTSFDRDRAIARLQEQQPDLSNTDASQTVTPRFDKKIRCVSRDNLLEQAEKLMNELACSKALLEIRYEDEVGTGLGPTLEFYTLASRELQRSDLMLFRGDNCPVPGAPQGTSSVPQYIHSPVGLFPTPLGPSTRFSVVEDVCAKFRFLGKLMAKSIVDSRMLDIPLSEAFYKWMLGTESTFTAQDLQHVDPVLANSFSQLAAVAVKKHTLESDPLLTGKALAIGIESLTMEGGGLIEDLDVDFTLPGYPDIALKPGGKDIQVSIHNLDDYLKLVVDWTLLRGVARQMESFKEGFNSVFSLSSMRGLFYPSEMDMVVCGAHHQKWDIKELMDCCRPDHGYSHDSKAVQFLFEVLSTYDTAEQRQFVQFVTGSPRLPVGGFKALNPPLTIVRKTVESPRNPDDFLPSVMTCVNYLKLPDYSSYQFTRDRLHFALQEGKHSFHLS